MPQERHLVHRFQTEQNADGFFDTFVLFEKFEGAKNPHQCYFQAGSVIRSRIEDYVSHTTNTYRAGDSIYSATVLVLKMETPISLAESNPPSMDVAPFTWGTSKQKPTVDLPDTALTVTYMIYHGSQVYHDYQDDIFHAVTAYQGPVLTMEGKLFELKEISFPLTRALYGVAHDISEVSGKLEDLPYEVRAIAKFNRWYGSGEDISSRIVSTSCEVSKFLDVFLTMDRPISLEQAQLRLLITRSTVTLVQHVSNMESASFDFDQRHKQFNVREDVLLDSSCRVETGQLEALTLDGKLAVRIPSSLINLELPEREPTMFTDKFSRTYAIRITLEVRSHDGGPSINLTTFSEISWALSESISSSWRGQKEPPIGKTEPEAFRKLVRIEQQALSSFYPNEIGRGLLQEVSNIAALSYVSHQSESFLADDDINTVSVIYARGSGTSIGRDIAARSDTRFEQMLSQFGYYPMFEVGEILILCEVLESSAVVNESHDMKLAGGLYLGTIGKRMRCSIPFLASLHNEDDRWPKGAQVSYPCDMGLDLRCEYRSPSLINQAHSTKVVIPEMCTYNFLKLRLEVCGIDVAKHLPTWKAVVVTIKKVWVSVIETLQSNDYVKDTSYERTEVILTKEVNESVSLRDCKFDGPFANVATLPIAPELYACCLPDIGPTFFSDRIHRTYQLRIDIWFQIGKDPQEHHSNAYQKINVARVVHPREMVQEEVVQPERDPPPYSP